MDAASRASEASEIARLIFKEAARRNLHLALAELPIDFLNLASNKIEVDRDRVTCLRSVLMTPEHRAWIDEIWSILDQATATVLHQRAAIS
jgi:hypothetical protein